MNLTDLAMEFGFSYAAPLSAAVLEFRADVREMCSADRCGSYGRNWCCPPACPDLEQMRQRMQQYDEGVLVQTVVQMEDDFDYESMIEGEKCHKQTVRNGRDNNGVCRADVQGTACIPGIRVLPWI